MYACTWASELVCVCVFVRVYVCVMCVCVCVRVRERESPERANESFAALLQRSLHTQSKDILADGHTASNAPDLF